MKVSPFPLLYLPDVLLVLDYGTSFLNKLDNKVFLPLNTESCSFNIFSFIFYSILENKKFILKLPYLLAYNKPSFIL
jgi:hypothetical protein